MKYRILKSVAHNFSQSFVSYMNYFDDDYVIEDLLRIVRNAEGGRVSICWASRHGTASRSHAAHPQEYRALQIVVTHAGCECWC